MICSMILNPRSKQSTVPMSSDNQSCEAEMPESERNKLDKRSRQSSITKQILI